MRRAVSALATAALVAACAPQPPATPPAAGDAGGGDYAFVVLGEDGQAVARVITRAGACPSITVDGRVEPMALRAAPATVAQRPTQSKPSAFPVRVCDRALPAGVGRAELDGRPLPLPKASAQRIVVIGDTGCRIKAADNVFQACNDAARWPFAAVASAAADARPDLVIHVGDYHYRESACPARNAGCAGSPWGYGWDAWEADFFRPGAPLLAAAPWIVVRGNHESCARAGQGWWRLVDPRPLAPGRDCNDPANDRIGDYSDPYAVPLGAAPAADTQLIVFDSSLAGIAPLAPGDPMFVAYRAQFERAFALAARKPSALFAAHHPVLAYASNPSHPETPYPGNAALQSVLATLEPVALFPPNVQALLSGHNHIFEVVSFATPQPAQFVSGNGGDWLDARLPLPLPPGTTPFPGAAVAQAVAASRFGFMTMEREGALWRIVAYDATGVATTRCTLEGRKAACEPA